MKSTTVTRFERFLDLTGRGSGATTRVSVPSHRVSGATERLLRPLLEPQNLLLEPQNVLWELHNRVLAAGR